jgi:hypothetical protein
MERHLSTGVATTVPLMAVRRAAVGTVGIRFDAVEKFFLMRKLISQPNMSFHATLSVTGY